MNLNSLLYIVTTANAGSISKASKDLFISQSALSRHIKKIEEELGLSLFERSGDGVTLTKAGIIFVNDAQTILYSHNQLMEELKERKKLHASTIRLMIDHHLYSPFLCKCMHPFRDAFPQIHLEINRCSETEAKLALIEGDADLGFLLQCTPPKDDLIYQRAMSDPLVLVFPESFSGSFTTAEDFNTIIQTDYPLILPDTTSSCRAYLEDLFVHHHIFPKPILETGEFASARDIVSQSNYCTFLPLSLAQSSSALQIISSDTIYLSCEYSAVYREDLFLTTQIRFLLNLFFNSFS